MGKSGRERPEVLMFQQIIARLDAMRDSGGNSKPAPIPLIDPTANVLSLVAAAMQRQDDLRLAEKERQDDIREIKGRYNVALDRLRDKLTEAELKRIDALTLAESRRIDALLAEGKAAVTLAAEKSSTQATTLAQSVLASADALRSQVDATTKLLTGMIDVLRGEIGNRLTNLEQFRDRAGGASEQGKETRGNLNWIVGLLVGAGIPTIFFVLNALTR